MGKSSAPWLIPLAILFLVAPWIVVAVLRPPLPSPGLVAIPADGPGLNAPVSAAFADAPYYVLVNLASGATRTVPNPYRSKQALGLKSAHQLLGAGIGVVLVRNIRPEAFNALSYRGARIHVAHPGLVAELVREYTRGALAQLAPPSPPMPAPGPAPSARPPVTPQILPAPVPRLLAPALGVEVASVPKGALVVGVGPGSRASRAGIQTGDIIVSLGQSPVTGADALLRLASKLPPGVHVLVALERNGIRGELWVPP